MGNYTNFKLVVYCTADSLAKATEESLEQQIAFFERTIQPDKVYVEPYRDNILVSHEQLKMIKRVFAAHGIETAGGITTTINDIGEPKQRLFHTFCYTDEAMKDRLKEIVRHIASEFDEFIIDDFYFTNCTCDSCRAAKGDRTWSEFRLDLMEKISQECFIDTARSVNPNCKVTIKYPNWIESFQETGYNPGRQKDIHDMIYTGTETRHALHTQQHLPRYLSYSLMRWMENLAPGRNGGGWLDPYQCYPLDVYLEQGYLTVLSKPREVMLFCWHSLYDTINVPALGFQLHKLDGLMSETGNCVGLPVYHPANAWGEDHLHDYLGMLGIPFEPVPEFPADAPKVFLTASSACDPDIVEKLERYVAAGGKAVLSSGFVRSTLDRGLTDLTSMRDCGRRATVRDYMVELGGFRTAYPTAVEAVTIPVLEHRNNSTWTPVKGIAGTENFGVVLRDTYGKGQMVTIAIPDNMGDLVKYPPEVLTLIRREMSVAGCYLDGSTTTGLFAYDNDVVALYPFVVDGARSEQFYLRVQGAARKLVHLQSGREIAPLYTRDGETFFELFTLPGHFAFYRVEREGDAAIQNDDKDEVRSAPPA